MFFLNFSKADIRFVERELVWRIYTAAEALPMTRKVEIIDKKKFVAAELNIDNGSFIVYVTALAEPIIIPIYLFYQAQVAILTSEKTGILAKYSNFSNIFSPDSPTELQEHTRINDHPINLLDNKQLPYGSIYNLGPVELKTLKTYIEVNLASGFIRNSKSPTSAPILFIQKKISNFRLCINY